MNPFNFAPTASGAAKVQPMSSSDITRINRIRAANAAYPNILSNPPKNIGNLALSQSSIVSFNMRSAINRGIFSYGPLGGSSGDINNGIDGNNENVGIRKGDFGLDFGIGGGKLPPPIDQNTNDSNPNTGGDTDFITDTNENTDQTIITDENTGGNTGGNAGGK